MFNFSSTKNLTLKPVMALILMALIVSLTACKDGDNNNNAYINVSIAGSNAQTKTSRNTNAFSQDNTNPTVNVLPDGITRVDFTITDSNDEQTFISLPVGSKTETINIRVSPHRDLVIVIEALTGETVSFRGQSSISPLRPGQSYPLSVSLDELGVPNTPVILNLSQTGTSQYEGDSGSSIITFNVSLSSLANGNVTVDYATNDISATFDSDYITTDTMLTIPAGKLSASILVLVSGDTLPEGDETFTLRLSNVSANATLGDAVATGIIISDDFPGRLNDTGVTLCSDYSAELSNIFGNIRASNNINCVSSGSSQFAMGSDNDDDPVPGGQDAHFGRDITNNDDSNSLAGFDFTKVDANGSPLANQAQSYDVQPWPCVKDNYTGLTWEVKTTSGLQNVSSTYSWLNTTGINDGGDPGLTSSVGCTNGSGCDTQAYVADINGRDLCALGNWRLPTVAELLSIVNNSKFNPPVDSNYFPNTRRLSYNNSYWSSNTNPSITSEIWTVNFSFGETVSRTKANATGYIRLVHDEVIVLP